MGQKTVRTAKGTNQVDFSEERKKKKSSGMLRSGDWKKGKDSTSRDRKMRTRDNNMESESQIKNINQK